MTHRTRPHVSVAAFLSTKGRNPTTLLTATSYLPDNTPRVGKYRVTEEHPHRPGGQPTQAFTVDTWTATGWQPVLTHLPDTDPAPDADTDQPLTGPAAAATAAHLFLHHHEA